MESVISFLEKLDLRSPLFPNRFGRVITINKNTTIPEALKKMIDNHIMSLVVLDESGVVSATFSVLDLTAHFIHWFKPEDFKREDVWTLLNEKKDQLDKQKIVDIPEIGEVDKPYSILYSKSIFDALKIMLNAKAHRVVVVDEQDHLINLFSQSRIIDLISSCIDNFPEITKTIAELQIGFKKDLISVKEASPVYDAFKLMVEKKISGLAVVDDSNRLIGNISADDIKRLGFDVRYFRLIGGTVGEYIKAVRAGVKEELEQDEDDWKLKRPKAVFCKPNDTLKHVIKMVSFYEVHRCYVVDDDRKLIGVIPLIDILRTLIGLQH